MSNDTMLKMAKKLVVDYFNKLGFKDEDGCTVTITSEDVFIVWFCKTLQNWKALVGTHVHDGRYYEITYDGDFRDAYMDVYEKKANIMISMDDYD